MEKLGNHIFYLALLSFLISVIISLLDFTSTLNTPVEYETDSINDFLVYLLYVFLLLGLYKGNLFAQFLYFLFTLINILTLSILIENFLLSHPNFIYSMSLEVVLSSSSGLLILISLSYYIINKVKSKLSTET